MESKATGLVLRLVQRGDNDGSHFERFFRREMEITRLARLGAC